MVLAREKGRGQEGWVGDGGGGQVREGMGTKRDFAWDEVSTM